MQRFTVSSNSLGVSVWLMKNSSIDSLIVQSSRTTLLLPLFATLVLPFALSGCTGSAASAKASTSTIAARQQDGPRRLPVRDRERILIMGEGPGQVLADATLSGGAPHVKPSQARALGPRLGAAHAHVRPHWLEIQPHPCVGAKQSCLRGRESETGSSRHALERQP